MTQRTLGILMGALTAVLYGLIPTFFVPISEHSPHRLAGEGLSELTLVFYRFLFATLGIGMILIMKHERLCINRQQIIGLLTTSIMGAGSAFLLAAGYKYMSSGIATTLHFLYPALTATLMMCFFGEAKRKSTWTAIILATFGVGILNIHGKETINTHGVIIVILSAVCFAFYLIRLNMKNLQHLPNLVVVFYIMLFSTLFFGTEGLFTHSIQPINGWFQWICLIGLGIVSTALPNISLIIAIKYAGPTITGVLGALEPIIAVLAGFIILNEQITWNALIALLFILPSIVIIAYHSKNKTSTTTQQP